MSKPRHLRDYQRRKKGHTMIRESGLATNGISTYWGKPRKKIPDDRRKNGEVRIIVPARNAIAEVKE